jgi:hypothetical protein
MTSVKHCPWASEPETSAFTCDHPRMRDWWPVDLSIQKVTIQTRKISFLSFFKIRFLNLALNTEVFYNENMVYLDLFHIWRKTMLCLFVPVPGHFTVDKTV